MREGKGGQRQGRKERKGEGRGGGKGYIVNEKMVTPLRLFVFQTKTFVSSFQIMLRKNVFLPCVFGRVVFGGSKTPPGEVP
jgi:hypothetical protein